ncbi:unnamed protein product [Lymnaea stagnalis]|uniref:Uncharacterized protein n=1 Tax=Lymnaea stagnalis TaxID=6523 RepID=A0AAV2H5C0_LYMST
MTVRDNDHARHVRPALRRAGWRLLGHQLSKSALFSLRSLRSQAGHEKTTNQKMPSSFPLLFIGALVVAMTTSAPVSGQEKLLSPAPAGDSVDRAKRAEEEIVFGNQQNKPRVMAKKSDLGNILAPTLGEKDRTGVVIVHKELPVPPALGARAEAALESSRDNEKMQQAVEEAMKTVAEQSAAQAANVARAEVKELAKEEISKEVKAVDEKIKQELKNMENAAAPSASGKAESSGSNALPVTEVGGDDVEQFLQELQEKDDENGLDPNQQNSEVNDAGTDFYPIMYMTSPYSGQGMRSRFPFPYYRRRRSLPTVGKTVAAKAHRGSRRIKRDILDDFYDAYTVPYSSVDVNDALIPDPDQYVPLTLEEKEYLYRRLLNNLASVYDEPEDEPLQDEPLQDEPLQGEPDEYPYARGYSEPRDEPYLLYSPDRDDLIKEVALRKGLQEEDEPGVFREPVGYVKRNMVGYYPMEEEKRYFFPFSEEPETHWGAFVPEKRDYSEAIQRLQRLAMALSDNPGPYYREMVEEYRRK